jgi:hypothetical protein
VAYLGSVLVAAAPAGSAHPVPGAAWGLDGQGGEQAGDFIAGERDVPGGGWVAGVPSCGGAREERSGEHGEGGTAVPGGPGADLVFSSRPVRPFLAWRFSSMVHLRPAILTRVARGTGWGV